MSRIFTTVSDNTETLEGLKAKLAETRELEEALIQEIKNYDEAKAEAQRVKVSNLYDPLVHQELSEPFCKVFFGPQPGSLFESIKEELDIAEEKETSSSSNTVDIGVKITETIAREVSKLIQLPSDKVLTTEDMLNLGKLKVLLATE